MHNKVTCPFAEITAIIENEKEGRRKKKDGGENQLRDRNGLHLGFPP